MGGRARRMKWVEEERSVPLLRDQGSAETKHRRAEPAGSGLTFIPPVYRVGFLITAAWSRHHVWPSSLTGLLPHCCLWYHSYLRFWRRWKLWSRTACRLVTADFQYRYDQALYRVSQEERTKLRESVPYVKLYRYNPKHLYPKSNGYGDNGQRKVWTSCISA